MVFVRVHTGIHQGAEVEMTDSFTIEAASDSSSDLPSKAMLSIIDAGGPLHLSFTRNDQDWYCNSHADTKVLICDEGGQPLENRPLIFPCFISVRNNLFSLVTCTATPFNVPSGVSQFLACAASLLEAMPGESLGAPTGSARSVSAAAGILTPVNALAFLGLALALGIGALGALFMPQPGMTNEIKDPKPNPVRVVRANVSALENTHTSLMDSAQKEDVAKNWILASLEQFELAEAISVKALPGQLHLSGELNTRQIKTFEKVLLDFEKLSHDILFTASIRERKPALPFKIKEMSTGSNGWIVTDSGVQVFVGGEHKGYRLVSLSQKRIQFTGPDSIDLSL
ncbi:hypothetical protein [Limnobacter alexandrii]|uniref:hypothetical protein n=1 Tax=Limnobacter alexandrii TaxID=2570352 RepID=UPI00110958FF|nr:hypothetical protein [Limnobacter alexandrii]